MSKSKQWSLMSMITAASLALIAAGCGSGGEGMGGTGTGGSGTPGGGSGGGGTTTLYSCSAGACVANAYGTFTTPTCNNSCSAGGGGAAACTVTGATMTTSVSITDFAFTPACIKVNAGQTVLWTNNGYYTHTVTSSPDAAESYNSGDLGSGMTFSHMFTTPGTDGYYCIHHLAAYDMTATVLVQ